MCVSRPRKLHSFHYHRVKIKTVCVLYHVVVRINFFLSFPSSFIKSSKDVAPFVRVLLFLFSYLCPLSCMVKATTKGIALAMPKRSFRSVGPARVLLYSLRRDTLFSNNNNISINLFTLLPKNGGIKPDYER